MEHLSRNLILLCYSLSCLIHSHLVVITMLSYLDKCIHTIEDGGVVNSVYFDFAKACNSLHHQMLLGKPESYGINRNILKWVKVFSSNRRQSQPGGIGCSSRKPILFVIYIYK